MRPELERACGRFELPAIREGPFGHAGDRLGKGTGASIEFVDFREYLPGDDLRHVDWRAYARTDQLKIRLHREEVTHAIEIVADLSPSMAVTAGKEAALRDLVEAFAFWGERDHGRVRRLRCGGDRFEDADAAAFDRPTDAAAAAPVVPLRPRSIRILISDFLFPQSPIPVLRACARGAAALSVVQLLDPWEAAPDLSGATLLVDCETGQRVEVALDRETLADYASRLGRLKDSVSQETRALGGRYACLPAAEPQRMFVEGLLPAGIVEHA